MCARSWVKILGLCTALLMIAIEGDCALEDGFVAAKKIPGKHITVFCESGVELSSLAGQLNIGPQDMLLAGKSPAAAAGIIEQEFAEMVDTLFVRVCDVLDMRLFSFTGTIKICRDDECLKQIYADLFGRTLNPLRPFYVYANNTIYTSANNCTRAMVGHEIAHAVMCHYFVVLPSEKIQEILSAYVEYQLGKAP